jgi:hypothetical protein
MALEVAHGYGRAYCRFRGLGEGRRPHDDTEVRGHGRHVRDLLGHELELGGHERRPVEHELGKAVVGCE